MSDNNPIKQRLNITFGKFGALRYTSTLDLAKVWERVLRRANLPILYSQGFNARPRIQLASPLPLGISSECEILDVSLREPITIEEGLRDHVKSVSPTGLEIYKIEEIEIWYPSLQSLVTGAKYRIRIEGEREIERDELQKRIDALLAAEVVEQEKRRMRGQTVTMNVRPLIYDLSLHHDGEIIAHLAVGQRGNLRPDFIVNKLQLEDTYHSIHRFALFLEAAR